MGKNKKNRLPEKQSKLVNDFYPKNEKQAQLVNMIKKREVVISTGSAGTGKAQPLYSTIYTPNGPIQMRDVKIGTIVSTPEGGTASVIGIYPQGLKDCYRITFTDGVYTDCCSEHLWKVYTDSDRSSKNKERYSILQTKDMIGTLRVRSDKRRNYKIPVSDPVFYNKVQLPLEPYLLGLLLGDGGMTQENTIISTTDNEIIEYLKCILPKYNLNLVPTKDTLTGKHCDYRISGGVGNKFNYVSSITGELGVRCKSEFKSIPKKYLYSSIEDRIELLQGLMDTDGTVDNRGKNCSFCTTSTQLKDDFCELVRSLGGIASVSIKKNNTLGAYIISVNLPNSIKPFKLTRKLEKLIPKTKYKTPRYIDNIEYIGQVEQQCIMLDSDSHLYLTDNHIVTHNTYVALATALSLLGETYKSVILVKSVTTLPGEEVGFIKGDLAQKMEPFIMSYTWNIDKMCGKDASKKLMDADIVRVLPLAFIRGISIDNSIVIIDEAQNIDHHTFKTIMTRIGTDSKYVFLGDTEQIDRKKKQDSCLQTVLEIFKDSDVIGTVEFTDEDCVRNPIIPQILSVLRENNI